jgi:hypothetical protein
MNLRDHLSYMATFSLSQRWPLNTGLAVLLNINWKVYCSEQSFTGGSVLIVCTVQSSIINLIFFSFFCMFKKKKKVVMQYHKNTSVVMPAFTMHVIEYCIYYTYVFLYTLSNNDGLLRIKDHIQWQKKIKSIFILLINAYF